MEVQEFAVIWNSLNHRGNFAQAFYEISPSKSVSLRFNSPRPHKASRRSVRARYPCEWWMNSLVPCGRDYFPFQQGNTSSSARVRAHRVGIESRSLIESNTFLHVVHRATPISSSFIISPARDTSFPLVLTAPPCLFWHTTTIFTAAFISLAGEILNRNTRERCSRVKPANWQ